MKRVKFGILLSQFALLHAASCYWSSSMYAANSSFFDSFDFETFDDPTHGYTDYIGKSEAESSGLISYPNGQVYIGVDHSSVSSGRGRKSIRLSSKRVLNGNNLVIIDLEHMPSTAGYSLPKGCSVWPAFWTVGPDWPNSGEIDIIEYVNTDSNVLTTLHTNSGCDQSSEDSSTFSGHWSTGPSGNPSDNCDVNAGDQYSNAGCGIAGWGNVGDAFNSNGQRGGVYALEWVVDQEIRAFYFPRWSIPWDIASHTPNPDTWGQPYARFQLTNSNSSWDFCNSNHFRNHNIVFDNTFCGDWAGSVFPISCSSSVSCSSFVQNNPAEFSEAYWLLNYVEVFDKC